MVVVQRFLPNCKRKRSVTAVTTTAPTTQMTVAGDSGPDTIDIGTDTLTIAGGTGITSAVTADTATLTLDNTAVTPGSYGGTTTVPVITIDQQGRITAASTSTIGSVLNITGDSGSDSINLGTDTLEFEGGTGVTTTVPLPLIR